MTHTGHHILIAGADHRWIETDRPIGEGANRVWEVRWPVSRTKTWRRRGGDPQRYSIPTHTWDKRAMAYPGDTQPVPVAPLSDKHGHRRAFSRRGLLEGRLVQLPRPGPHGGRFHAFAEVIGRSWTTGRRSFTVTSTTRIKIKKSIRSAGRPAIHMRHWQHAGRRSGDRNRYRLPEDEQKNGANYDLLESDLQRTTQTADSLRCGGPNGYQHMQRSGPILTAVTHLAQAYGEQDDHLRLRHGQVPQSVTRPATGRPPATRTTAMAGRTITDADSYTVTMD